MTDLRSSEKLQESVTRHFRRGGLANDTAWGALHDLSQLVLMTATFTLLSRQLAVNEYGQYAGIYGIVGPLGGLTWSGIGFAILQRSIRERDKADQISRDFFLLSVGLGLVGATIGTLLGAQFIGGMALATIIPVMVAELVAQAVAAVSIAMVQAQVGFANAVRLRLVILAIRLVVLLSLSLTGTLTIANLAVGYAIGFSIYLAVLLIMILPSHGIPFSLRRPGPGIVRVTAKVSMPMAVGVLQQDGDKTVMNAYGQGYEAGLYAAAFRFVATGLMPLRALEGAAFQRFLPHNEDERNEHTRRAARFAMLALGISLVLGVAILLGRPLFTLIVGEKYDAALKMIPWLLPFLPLTALSNAPANGLLGLGKLGVRASIYAGSATVSLSLYITLVPSMSWKGAVVGTIVGEAFQATIGWVALLHYQRQHNATLDEN